LHNRLKSLGKMVDEDERIEIYSERMNLIDEIV
jgi:hypothetical protein